MFKINLKLMLIGMSLLKIDADRDEFVKN